MQVFAPFKDWFGVEAGGWVLPVMRHGKVVPKRDEQGDSPRSGLPSRQRSPENASKQALRRHIITSKLHSSGNTALVERIGTL
jgi:hypothetical protein